MKWLLVIAVFNIASGKVGDHFFGTKVFATEAECKVEAIAMEKSTRDSGFQSLSKCVSQAIFNETKR